MSNLVRHAKLVSGGRLQVPADVRRELHIVDGDSLRLEVIDGELRIRSMHEVFRRISERMRQYVPEGVSLVDELIADRRAEAARE